MATYKVIQDIEAEDKLVGPLTFRQFVYAGLAALNIYLTFLVVSKGAWFMAAAFLPVAAVCGFFAWPWSRDQPTEVWALAKIRFLFKPRKRIWNQSGVKELVTITVPKKIEHILTKGLSQTEVKSRLRALADTIDSRGWAIKNVGGVPLDQGALALAEPDSDRLINATSLPQPAPGADAQAPNDILDMQNNPVAKQFDTMIAASAKAHREDVLNKMREATPVAPPASSKPLQSTQPANDYWFLNQPQAGAAIPQNTVTFNTQVVAPGTAASNLPVTSAMPTPDEEAFIREHESQPAFSPNTRGHLHVIQPLSEQARQGRGTGAQPSMPFTTQPNPSVAQGQPAGMPTAASAAASTQPPVTPPPDAAILDLAINDDLNVATIAREANKRKGSSDNEVVISLH
jgi:hypothetical protein